MIKVVIYDNNMMQENTYLLIDEGSRKAAVVDPGCYPPAMKAALEDTKGLDYILLTHGHGDHIAALEELKADYPDAKIIAAADEKVMLSDADINGSNRFAPHPVEIDADMYVNDHDRIRLGENEFEFIMTPGHTPGGMCIYTDGRLFSGDTLFSGSVGRTDLYGGSWEQLLGSIRDQLLVLPDETRVYPGHGLLTTIGMEKKGNPFV